MNCQGLHLDVPDSFMDGLQERMEGAEFAPADEVLEEIET
jgi:hypothetical protein